MTETTPNAHTLLEELDARQDEVIGQLDELNEQIEEEATAQDIIDKLTFVGDDRTGQFMIDQELAQRVPPPETQAEQD